MYFANDHLILKFKAAFSFLLLRIRSVINKKA